MKHPAQQVAFQEYIAAINECTERIARLDEQILKAANEWRWAPRVKALEKNKNNGPNGIVTTGFHK